MSDHGRPSGRGHDKPLPVPDEFSREYWAAARRHEAGQGFSGKIQRRLNVWEKYAHILLQTNELTYFN